VISPAMVALNWKFALLLVGMSSASFAKFSYRHKRRRARVSFISH